MNDEKHREGLARGRLRWYGFLLRKERGTQGYMIVDRDTNTVVAGGRYEMNLENVEEFTDGVRGKP